MSFYNFDCGCNFPIFDEQIKDDGFPSMEIDYYNLNHKCQKAWSVFCDGRTKGIFQLEKSLGKKWSKEMQPVCIDEVAALVSIIRPGCISYDTKILTSAKRLSNGRMHYKRQTIESLYWNDPVGKSIVSYDETTGSFIENKIEDVIFTGTKSVFSIKMRKGKRTKSVEKYDLKCTDDHKLLTSRGWKKLEDMKVGDRFAVFSLKKNVSKAIKNAHGEKNFRTICFSNYEYNCVMCDWKEASLDVNHLDGNRKTNNSPENLNFFCPNHHKMYSEGLISKEHVINARDSYYKLPKSNSIEWAEFLGKEYVEDCKVFDITMADPHHNFIAGNIVVHNCLKAIVEGKSMTQHFIDRKNGEEPYHNIHPLADSVLNATYGVTTYQEQTLALAKLFAGYDLIQADTLRRAIGKKKADVMAQCRGTFIEGCEATGIINGKDATALFDVIEKSNRYSFNKAHAVEYAETAYWCAVAKAHFPLQFFCSWLSNANSKQKPREEISELIQDAKAYGIDVRLPSLLIGNENFIIEDKELRFGIGNVKSVGFSKVTETFAKAAAVETAIGKRLAEMSWYELLIFLLPKLNKSVVINLISCGALSNFGLTRQKMLFEYNKIEPLTDRELKWIQSNKFDNIVEAFSGLISSGVANKTRVKKIVSLHLLLEKPPEKLEDTSDWIAGVEHDLLGVAITCSKLDSCDTSAVNCTCANFPNTNLESIVMALQLDRVTEWRAKTENAKTMCFMTAHDKTGSIEISVSSNEYEENGFLLFVGNTVIISGYKNKKGSLAVRKVLQI